MDYTVVIAISFIVFFFLLVTGHYISSVMFGAAMVGLYMIGGLNLLKGYMVNDPYQQVASYTLTTVPMYVLMSQFIMQSGIIRDCYATVYKLSSGKRGLLGVLTILLGGFLGAVSGSGTATSAAMGQIAVPEMRAKGYSDALSGAVAACAGSLSAVIPPSLILIIYGSISQVSVGALFMATVIPGILIMLIFGVLTVITLQTKSEKERAKDNQIEELEMDLTLGRMILVVVIGVAIMAIIFGGIYTGRFTPTEAGAFGAFLGLVTLIITGNFKLKTLYTCLIETVKVAGMSSMIILAASIFSRLVSRSLLPRYLINSLSGLIAHPTILLLIILVLFFFLYMILDGSAVVLMTVPILMPILQEMHIDLTWFGVFICMLATMGALTPPVGMCVYATSGSSKIPLGDIFPITLLFAAVATFVVGALMIFFPALATWLPSTM